MQTITVELTNPHTFKLIKNLEAAGRKQGDNMYKNRFSNSYFAFYLRQIRQG